MTPELQAGIERIAAIRKASETRKQTQLDDAAKAQKDGKVTVLLVAKEADILGRFLKYGWHCILDGELLSRMVCIRPATEKATILETIKHDLEANARFKEYTLDFVIENA